jgi:hypothetical protein
MKKLLLALAFGGLLIGCVEQEAEAIEWESGVSVTASDSSVSFTQDGNEFAVGFAGATVYHSDSVDIGVSFGMNVVGPLAGTVSYEYTSDEDNVVGLKAPITLLGLTTTPSVNWNISDSDIDGALENTFSLIGAGVRSKFIFDLDDTDFTGSEFEVNYTWNMSDTVAIQPYVEIPMDDDWTRGDTVAGLRITMNWTGSSSQ